MGAAVVLHVVRPAAGGMRQHVLSLVASSDRGSFQPVVACPPDPLWLEQLRGAGVPAYALPIAGGLSPARDILAARALHRLMADLRPALIHCHGAKAALVGRLALASAQMAGTARPLPPLLYTVHGPAAPGSRAAALLADLAERALAPLATAFVAVSPALGERLKRAWGIPEGRVYVIPNGVDVAAFHRLPPRAAARRALGLDPLRPTVGMAARLAPGKGVEVFLRAAAVVARRHPEAQFAVAGDGPLRRRVERLAGALGLGGRLRLLGFRSDMPRVLASLDVLVLPSQREGLPLVLLEGLAAGRAVVATRAGGIPDVLWHGRTGLLAPPGDPHALAAAVGLLLEDEVLRRRLGQAGRRHVQRHFSLEMMASRTHALYRILLARGCGAPAWPCGGQGPGEGGAPC